MRTTKTGWEVTVESRGADANYSGFRLRVAARGCAKNGQRRRRCCARARAPAAPGAQRTRVQDKPNSIARVNARFAGRTASSSVSAAPRGQRSSGQSCAKSCVRPCVNAMPA